MGSSQTRARKSNDAMRRMIAVFALLFPCISFANSGTVPLTHANNDLRDRASLQAGAKTFVNYCMGCHSAEYSRYQRVGDDLGIPEEVLKKNLMFAGDKVGETMGIAMSKQDGKKWFGVIPPDLTVIARSRGVDWLYTYLTGFYLDNSRPWGVNNLVFKDVGMPHVLWEQQGWQKPVFEKVTDAEGHSHEVLKGVALVDEKDAQKAADYRQTVRNLVNFLEYVGEPAKTVRQDLGWKVILFLAIFFVFAYALKKEYWADIPH